MSDDVELLFAAEFLDDVENIRIATENRLRALTALGADADAYEPQAQAFRDLEHQATLQLQRVVRRHPYGGWVQRTLGVGEKQGGRLLAAVGNPYWNAAEDRARRGPAELWGYCGYAPEQKRKKGVKSNWNATAKMRAFLCAEGVVKASVRKVDGCDDSDGYDVNHRGALTPLAQVYLDARANWATKETSDGHKHNHALRLVAKALLKDLWLYARDLATDHFNYDTQREAVGGNNLPATVRPTQPNLPSSPELSASVAGVLP